MLDAMALPESRMQFVFALRSRGVTDARVLTVIENTPRERFLAGIFRARALEDTPLPISCGQTTSQPSVVGLMIQALAPTPRSTVLEVGTGTGYQAAILSRLSRRVYTVERHKPLARLAQRTLDELGCSNTTVIAADGARGLPAQAPFDRIMLAAAAEDPPSPLLAQLRVGGIMVLPVGQSDRVQRLIRVTRTETGLDYHELCDVRFVPLVEGVAEDVLDR